jgi:hypothetical protein
VGKMNCKSVVKEEITRALEDIAKTVDNGRFAS